MNKGITVVEPKTVELCLIIGDAVQVETWETAHEAGAVVDQWIAEAEAGQYEIEIREILHTADCHDADLDVCQCAQFSTDHNTILR